jgi:hypothetical protein
MDKITILSIVVFVNALVTAHLWQTATRGPERPNRKLFKKLHGKRITPKPPPPLDPDALVTGFAGEDTLRFLKDFEDFGNVVNWWLADNGECLVAAWGRPDKPWRGK